ncbi:MAG: phage shock protein E [Myxococcota bacterium]|jgi:phage shock protein E
MSKQTIFLIVALLAFAAWRFTKARRSPEQLALMRTAVQADGLLVDVRSPGEFSSGHAPEAVNIPVGQLSSRLGELGDKDRAIIVCCASGARSASARRMLLDQGFSNVMDLGPWQNWNK